MGTDLTRDNDLTLEKIQSLSDENYNPNDIRTYTAPPLSKYPRNDVKANIALLKNSKKEAYGGSTYQTPLGSFFGESSVELDEKTGHMVLNFPKATNFNQIKQLKLMNVHGLLPSWMIERYEIQDEFVYRQKTPIFYDTAKDKFLVFFDTEFFRDLTPSALNFKGDNLAIYHGKDKKPYGAFIADSMKELKEVTCNKKGTPFCNYLNKYRQRFLDATKGQRVIVVAMKHRDENERHSNSDLTGMASYSDPNVVRQLVLRQEAKFELYQGALIDNLIYLMDEDGKINPSAIMVSAKHRRNSKERIKLEDHGDYTLLMMKYTEKDWNMLKSIHQRLSQLLDELSKFFDSGYNEDQIMDNSVSMISSEKPMLLINKKD